MADGSIQGSVGRRHPNAGRKQTPEHIAKRNASWAATVAAWSPERRAEIGKKNGEALRRRSEDDKKLSNNKRAVSISRITTKPVIIYGLSDPRTGLIRYVGKSSVSAKKRYRDHQRCAEKKTPRHVYNWWRSLTAIGYNPVLTELEMLPIGSDWVDAEQRWITKFRVLGNLVNSCDGGQGSSGHKFSEESLERLRTSHKGQTFTREQVEARRPALLASWANNPERRNQPPEVAQKRIVTMASNKAAGKVRKKRPGLQYVIEGMTFNGCHEVAKHYGVTAGTVIRYQGDEKAFLASVARIRSRERTGTYFTPAEQHAKKLTYNRAYKLAQKAAKKGTAEQGSLPV